MTAHTRRHSGYATQAKRRGEQFVQCTGCTQRAHKPDYHDLIDEDATPTRVTGLVIYWLVIVGAVIYLAPIFAEYLLSIGAGR